jgi:hypothetical protein
MVRYRTNHEVKVLKDNEFINEFTIRPNDSYWKTIEVVQTCTKSKTGSGTPIFVHFFAPMDEENCNEDIVYDLSKFPSNADLIKSGDFHLYALKQVNVMAEYISRVRGYEIL